MGYSPWSHKKLDSNEQLTLPKGLKSERENVTMEAVVGVMILLARRVVSLSWKEQGHRLLEAPERM